MAGDIRACVYGQAVGDALGVPFEFMDRDGFRCEGMVGHGTHDQPAGTWSDDTSMALAICDSYRELRRIDIEDIRRRFLAWYREGAYTVDGLFDIGISTSRALAQGHGLAGEQDNGNGSLMRTMPLAFTDVTDEEVRAVSAITHAHPTSTAACVEAVRIARRLAAGMTVAEAAGERWDYLVGRTRDEISSSGYVRHTLEAALWCLLNTGSYRDCVLAAVNLGEDTDTTGAVAGAFAGIAYGMDGIPAEWLDALRGKDVIEACLY